MQAEGQKKVKEWLKADFGRYYIVRGIFNNRTQGFRDIIEVEIGEEEFERRIEF